jgi:hypothetical protein
MVCNKTSVLNVPEYQLPQRVGTALFHCISLELNAC